MTQSTSPPGAPPHPGTVTLTIDGKTVTARKGTLLIEAARQAGVEIPVFCYHPKLKPVGACRMCLVQIEKLPRLQTACTTPVAADMVVHTNTRDVLAAQNGVIELLLANHPLDCPICDKGGECPLQDNTFRFGLGTSRFGEQKRHLEKALPLSDRIVLDRERCIMCYRCVRFHQEIPGDEALAALDRGAYSEIGTLPGEAYDSIFSGNTIELCPVGALTSLPYRFKARPWDLTRTPSVCSGCAVGCNVEVHSRTETILRVVSRENPQVDDGWLCDVGRFATPPAPRAERPDQPAVRDAGGLLRPTTWETALRRSVELLASPPATAALASPALSNEALWLLEHVVRPHLPPGARAGLWPPAGAAWPVQGAIANLPRCRRIVLAGLDPWFELPVLALWIRRAVLEGAKLVVVGPTNGLFRDTAHWLRTEPGAEAAVLAALQAALEDGAAITPGGTADRGGTPEADVRAAAASLREGSGPSALLAGSALAGRADARAALQAVAGRIGATAKTGLVGAPALAANGRGAWDLAPALAQADTRALLAEAADGGLSTLLLVGDESWAELPTGAARLVVATARPLPDDPRLEVVLPLAHAYERSGTVTNLEGRVQHQEGAASPPGHARPDWAALAALAGALGADPPTRLAEIRRRIQASTPSWAGLELVSSLPVKPAREAGVQRG